MIEIIFSVLIAIVMACIAWKSSVIVSERKARYRAGTHDYYDNPIEKENDETIS